MTTISHKNLTTTQLHEPKGADSANADEVYVSDGAGSGAWTALVINPSYALYQNQQTSGTSGPAPTAGSWQTYPITTEVFDADGIGSLASNQVTLAAGTYEIEAWCAAQGATASRARLFNATDAAVIIQGPNILSASAVGVLAPVKTLFTLAGAKAVELQIYRTASGTAPTALTTGDVEVYASILIKKLP